MKKNFILFFTIFLFTFVFGKSLIEKYPEITDEEYLKYELKFYEEKDEDEKKYIEPVIRPRKFDINRDGKISKREIREALKYVLYPKDPKKRIEINKELENYVKNNIDLFIKNLEEESFTYKQFCNLMKEISIYQFLNNDVIEGLSKIQKTKVHEYEGDL